jgi:hypothetical protein
MPGIKKKWVSWEEFAAVQGGNWTPSPHTHPRSDITDFFGSPFWASIPDKPSTYSPDAHALVGAKHTASGLTVGHVIRATGATTFAWQQLLWGDIGSKPSTFPPGDHAPSHHLGGGDEVNHDSLAGFVAAEHLSLPNTIANVLSDHNKAAHDALNIDADTLDNQNGSYYLAWANITGKPSTYPPSTHKYVGDAHFEGPEGLTLGKVISVVGELEEEEVAWEFPAWGYITGKPSTYPADNHALVGTKHTASGLTTGHVLRATGASSFAFQAIQSGDLPSHTHVKANITDTPWAWTDVSKSGSNLTDLVTRSHSALQNIGTNDHHAKLHALDHQAGGTDGLSVGIPSDIGTSNQAGTQTNFVRRDHVHKHPSGLGTDLHHPQAHTLASHSSKYHSELAGVGANDHHAQLHASAHHSGGGDALTFSSIAGFSTYIDQFLKQASNVRFNQVRFGDTYPYIFSGGTYLEIETANGTTQIGMGNGSWTHFYTDGTTGFYFSKSAHFAGQIRVYGQNVYLSTNGLYLGDYYLGSLVANNKVPDSDMLDGYQASQAAGNNTVVVRTASGYIYCNFLNTTSGETTSDPTHYFVETGSDSFLRKMTPAYFIAKLVAGGLMPKTGGIFTGACLARDHGSASVDEVVNVCYGTGDPPAANTTTIGALYIKYQA